MVGKHQAGRFTMSKTNTHSPKRNFLVVIGKLVLVIILMCCTGWGALALQIDIPFRRFGIFLAAVYTIGSLVCLCFILPFRRNSSHTFGKALAVFLVLFFGVFIWWNTLSPSHEREWYDDVSQMPWGEIDDDFVTLHNVRDFNYRSASDYDLRYLTRTVNLADIEGADYFLCYWGSPWIAHPIVSFRFKGSDPIALSVETRKETGENYSTVKGFFRQYELIYIVAEERDIVRLRTNFREGEDVYLYRTSSSPERARAIFLDYVRRINELHAEPEFYNALKSNCTTNIRLHTAAADGDNLAPWDWRILLTGKIDEWEYERGAIDQSMPFEKFKARSHINKAAQKVTDLSVFSAEIRRGLPGF
jgi:hypothetical protein